MTSAPILQVHQVSRNFGNFKALSNVSVDFAPHQLAAIIGPNGAGKSTFFNTLSGALAPSSGKILFEGQDITALKQHEYARDRKSVV